ncbi:hypothetical protein KUTeg_022565 [Tegillarca granosa]|uniref:Acyltransferase 3 domain-containing protein n=1 Tax=Tegillarca granosa TaxID=220873 RepID=A0ABQ9EB56_TEGGR|nr:hypothetical protein KUTeg_022565 [Tegillarca granosa]
MELDFSACRGKYEFILSQNDRKMDISGYRQCLCISGYIFRTQRTSGILSGVKGTYSPLHANSRSVHDGPLWPENGIEKDFCKDTWWKNLLYINNIVDSDNQCFGWAWFLANDMQFYILSPLMFVPLYIFNGWGLISSAVFLIGNGVATYFVSVKYKLPPSTLGVVDEKTTFDYTINYYCVPWCRIGPYVIGVVAGYCLYNTNGRIKIHRALNLLGWAVATALSVTVLYGLHDVINGNPLSIEVAALYNATHRTVWGACVCWVVVAGATGNGGYINTLLSWEGFSPLSRLTYCAYLVHPILMYIYFENLRQPIYFTDMKLAFTSWRR